MARPVVVPWVHLRLRLRFSAYQLKLSAALRMQQCPQLIDHLLDALLSLVVSQKAWDHRDQRCGYYRQIIWTEWTANLVNSFITFNDTCIREWSYVPTIYEYCRMLLVPFSEHRSLKHSIQALSSSAPRSDLARVLFRDCCADVQTHHHVSLAFSCTIC